MTTKLTLSMDNQVIELAKIYAKRRGVSLSGLVENFLSSITTRGSDTAEISPRVQKLMGSIKLPRNFDYKKELGNALAKKYSK